MKEQKATVLIKTGETISKIRHDFKDFEDWFSKYMGFSDFLQVDVYRNQQPPKQENLAGIVITGSAAMVSHREEWSENTAAWLKKAVMLGVPILGVCYGHQLLAHALGGKVGPNPKGRQIGTVQTRLSNSGRNDRLLGYLPRTFAAQSSHSEVVFELPPGATRLATSPLDDNFAIRYAENTWGVQFHPEFSAPVMSEYIRYRADALIEEGLNPDLLLENVRDTREARSVLLKFKSLM
jgi:GMP synthase (glutamine-hydrolysing)